MTPTPMTESAEATDSRRSLPLYNIFLHIALIGLVVVTLLLIQENRTLRSQLPEPVGPNIVAGDVVSPFDALEQDGTQTTLDLSTAGEKDRLLFFFTSTCPVCHDNQPRWNALHERVADRIDVVGVSLDDPEQARGYLDGLDAPFRIVSIADPQSFALEQRVDRVPLTVLVGADGKVRDSWLGPLPEDVAARL